jgi:hypothetical protein
MILFHVTTTRAAASIRKSGFRERRKYLGIGDGGQAMHVRGVWFSDRPWFAGGAISADAVPSRLRIVEADFPGRSIRKYEIKNAGAPYREWCIPAALANEAMRR